MSEQDENNKASVNADNNSIAVGGISAGGNIGDVHIGNVTHVYNAAEDDVPLASAEIENGLTRFAEYLPERAPVMADKFNAVAKKLRATLGADVNALSPTLKTQREDSVNVMKMMCLEALDISFRALCLGNNPPPYDARPPFLGLFAFHPEDREFFFGREALIQKLVKRIKGHSFLAVVGASGSGKSSLVMAGLIPALDAPMAYFTPSDSPAQQLQNALAGADANAVIVADQFEELFTLTRDDQARVEFIAQLLKLAQTRRVIVTLRADFWGEVAAYKNLKQEMQDHQELIAPMDADELRAAMEQQAEAVGLRFDPSLRETILAEVKDEPGAMPLLQHALWMLWKRRHGLWLKAEEYQAFGGVRQAIASTAEDVYASCSAYERERVRDIFLRLTRLDADAGDSGRDTRRRVPLGDLMPSQQDAAALIALLDKLANARLIVKTVDGDQTEIEVAHEALIRHWERLRGWLNEDRDQLRLRESVTESAKEWDGAQKDEALLNHRGGRLEDALALKDNARYGLTALELSYLNACVELRNRQQRERERRTRFTVIGLTVAAVIFLVLGSFGWVKSNEATAKANDAATAQANAEKQAKIAVARSAALQSIDLRDKQLSVAFLLGIEANQRLDNYQSRSVLFDNLRINPRLSQFLYDDDAATRVPAAIHAPIHLADSALTAFAISPDGKTIAAAYDSGKILLWDEITQKIIGELAPERSYYGIAGLVFSADGKMIAAFPNSSSDPFVFIWDVNTRALINEPIQGEDFISSVAFSNDGSYIVFGNSTDNLIDVYDVRLNQQVGRLYGHGDDVNCLAFSPDNTILASGSEDGAVILWDWKYGGKIPLYPDLIGHNGGITSVIFSPNGKTLVSVSANNTKMLWAIDMQDSINQTFNSEDFISNGRVSPDGKIFAFKSLGDQINLWELESHLLIEAFITPSTLLEFSPDGNILTYHGEDGAMTLWNAVTQKPVGPSFISQKDITSATFSADGKVLAAGNSHGTITLWDMESHNTIGNLDGHTDAILNMEFSQDGKILVSSSANKIILWNMADRQPINNPLESNGIMALSPNGKILAFGDKNGVPVLFDMWKYKPLGDALKGHAQIHNLSFSADGRILASSGYDSNQLSEGAFAPPMAESIILWDAATGQPIGQPLKNDSGDIAGIFSSDDKDLVAYDKLGSITLWDVDIQSWLDRSCQIAGRNFTSEEWTRYFPGEKYHATCPQWTIEAEVTPTPSPTP